MGGTLSCHSLTPCSVFSFDCYPHLYRAQPPPPPPFLPVSLDLFFLSFVSLFEVRIDSRSNPTLLLTYHEFELRGLPSPP